MSDENKLFTYQDSADIQHEIEISPKDFEFVQQEKSIHDVKFETKPTTFFRDACRRFVKNKSSVAGGIILGVLTILAFVLPATIPYNITENDIYSRFMPAKLFNAGTGWWDGTKKIKNTVYDPERKVAPRYLVDDFAHPEDVIFPDSIETFEENTSTANEFARGGFVKFSTVDKGEFTLYSAPINLNFNNYNYKMSFNVTRGTDYESSNIMKDTPFGVFFYYGSESDPKVVTLKDYSEDFGTVTIDSFEDQFKANNNDDMVINKGCVVFKIKSEEAGKLQGVLLDSVNINSYDRYDGDLVIGKDDSTMKYGMIPAKYSITDANAMFLGNDDNYTYVFEENKFKEKPIMWTRGKDTLSNLFNAEITKANFVMDSYEYAYGEKLMDVSGLELEDYKQKGWITYEGTKPEEIKSSFKLTEEGEKMSPVRSIETISVEEFQGDIYINATGYVIQYLKYGFKSMPRFMFGTDQSGKDLLKYTFDGLKTSLTLGIFTFVVCFTFGLIWGSISGYFGGMVDIIMERFCEILSGVPWIVIMTLIILIWGSTIWTFAAALCLTGWMGVAARTRTQFYRFKGREYILASRTLGSSDARLIFKHVLPNAMGTIITSSVLMIPSTIFSEATISYLGLGLQNLSSLGVILSDNQQFIQTNPILILFPSAIMALIMISFNLFGNGLRDAFNPSLKGAE